MHYRKILLAIMLGALALAALGGAGEMLLGGRDNVWIVAGTGVITALACGLLMLIGRLYDSPNTLPSGVLLTVSLIVCYLIQVPLIWMPNNGRELGDLLNTSTVAIALVSLPAAFFLRITRSAGNSLAGYVGTTAIAGAFIIMMAANVYGFIHPYHYQDETWGKLWQLSGVVAGCGMLAAGALAGIDRRWLWRWIGVVTSIALLYLGGLEIWTRYSGSTAQLLDALTTTVASIAAFIAYLNVALLCELQPGQGWLMAIAVAATGATLACADARSFIADSSQGYSDALERLIGALGILSGCATVAMLIVVRITRKTRDVAPPAEFQGNIDRLPELLDQANIGDRRLGVQELRAEDFHSLGDAAMPQVRLLVIDEPIRPLPRMRN